MPSFRLTQQEAWAAVAAAHTGMYTTLRRDGRPVTLPVWQVVIDERIYLRTPAGAAKLRRVRNDPRGFFMVETGTAWAQLAAVTIAVEAAIVLDDALAEQASRAIEEKYPGLGPDLDVLPDAVRAHYGAFSVIELTAVGRLSSWNNRALLGDSGPIEWA
ncbi:MAG TPA: pyridoxamine 5'-phosphate oxidase family protein [Solirubrobacteraceae bacterium]|jgi:PPOX class probable F420-dependent enzyme|nr:pyridoxamine 5'-phosphate oxidase family protein [Solirubrobacteraceae bacterium]